MIIYGVIDIPLKTKSFKFSNCVPPAETKYWFTLYLHRYLILFFFLNKWISYTCVWMKIKLSWQYFVLYWKCWVCQICRNNACSLCFPKFLYKLRWFSYWRLLIVSYVNTIMCLSLPCPVFVWGLPGLLATGSCCWVIWGFRSLNAAFPCWSCLSYLMNVI
jgi:hypothetical protein